MLCSPVPTTPMTGDEIHAARRTLGEMWGLGRPLRMSELGRLLRLSSDRPSETVRTWEQRGPTGPVQCAIEAWLDGARPRNLREVLPALSAAPGRSAPPEPRDPPAATG